MKRIVIIVLLSFGLVSFIGSTNWVYVCMGNFSKRYHYSETCKGLVNCNAEIKKVSIAEAKELGRDLCGWED